jgi:DNA-binding CsgD family transcriptional regulator
MRNSTDGWSSVMTSSCGGLDRSVSPVDVIPAPSPAAVGLAKEALARLRLVFGNSELAERIPGEVHRMGFTRILFSYIRNNTWFVRSAYAADDDELADIMLQVGRAHPRRLRRPLPESEMVRSRSPILIENPQSDPRLHTELVAVTNPKAYVAAPVYAWQTPLGLLHADAPTEIGDVDVAERDLLALFAEGVGAIFERNLVLARLRAMRGAVEEHTCKIGALAGAFEDELWENMDLRADADRADLDRAGGAQGELRPADARTTALTLRERQVLHMLATGKTNAQIADRLFITEGTVKSHVKHVMEKLGAHNRTEAVCKYRLWDAAPF